jgi:hypothetical protein
LLKTRLFGVLLIIIFAGLIYWGWRELAQEGQYYPKLAAFAPVGVVGGIFLVLFPGMSGPPTNTKERLIVLAVFVVGLIAGLINWFLMDPGFFGVTGQ